MRPCPNSDKSAPNFSRKVITLPCSRTALHVREIGRPQGHASKLILYSVAGSFVKVRPGVSSNPQAPAPRRSRSGPPLSSHIIELPEGRFYCRRAVCGSVGLMTVAPIMAPGVSPVFMRCVSGSEDG